MIDTNERKLSMLVFGDGVLLDALPDIGLFGTIGDEERLHLLGLYNGIPVAGLRRQGGGILERLRRIRELPALLVAFQSRLIHFTAEASLSIRGRAVRITRASEPIRLGGARSSLWAKGVPSVLLSITIPSIGESTLRMSGVATPSVIFKMEQAIDLNVFDPDLVAEAAKLETERLLEQALAVIEAKEVQAEEDAALRLLEVL